MSALSKRITDLENLSANAELGKVFFVVPVDPQNREAEVRRISTTDDSRTWNRLSDEDEDAFYARVSNEVERTESKLLILVCDA